MNTNKLPLVLALAAMLALPGCFVVVDDTPSVTIENQSGAALYEVYVAPQGVTDWGFNHLRTGEALLPGDILIVENLQCALYDALVVDDRNVECRLDGLDACVHEAWVVDNVFLDACAGAL